MTSSFVASERALIITIGKLDRLCTNYKDLPSKSHPVELILDSPTVGVDVGARAGIFEIVRALANDGMGIVMISDEIPETYYNADRILHMRDGRLVETFQPHNVDIGQIEMAVNG